MEIQTILIFVIVGAIAMTIVAGGLTSMMEEEPTTSVLGSGAVVGGLLGGALHYFGGSDTTLPELPSSFLSAIGSAPDMKVGLPAF